jgi:branched-chain amino acid transport system ATP-binding protein
MERLAAMQHTHAQHLHADGVSLTFSGVRALKSVGLTLERGKVLGLIGPNGAGKTTLINVLSGFNIPDEGQVLLDTQALHGLSADAFRRLGVARTFQGGRLFRGLTVQDNLEAAGVGLGLSRRQAEAEAQRVLHALGLAHLAPLSASALPYTDERRVGIARAVVGNPAFLLLDEPAAGMSEHEANDLRDTIALIVQQIGCGVLLIEHNVRLVLSICSHIVVMDAGEVIAQGDPQAIRSSERVRHAYMGSAADASDAQALPAPYATEIAA